MSTVDSKISNQKEQIDLLMDEFGYQPGYDEGSEINENDANGEEQGEENQYEEMEEENIEQECQEEQGEEEYYEEQGEEMVEQINYADNIPKLEHSFDAESTKRPLLFPLTESESEYINKCNLSINGGMYTTLAPPEYDHDDFWTLFGIGHSEPYAKFGKTYAVMNKEKPNRNKEFNEEKNVSTQEDNIFNEVNNSLYMYFQPNGNGYVIDNIDDFTINSDKRKTDSYTVKPQNSFEISNIKHGWQYFNTYGEYDYRTGQKLEDEIIKCWKHIPENLRQNALDAIVNNDAAKMNNVMNNTFAQVTKI